MNKINTNSAEIVNALILILLGSWILWYTSDFPTLPEGYPGPSLFPRIMAYGFLLCGIILFITKQETKDRTKSAERPRKKRIGVLISGIVLVSLFPFLQTYLYFVVALGVICFCFGLLLGVKWWKCGLTALSTSLFIYVVFIQILGVSL